MVIKGSILFSVLLAILPVYAQSPSQGSVHPAPVQGTVHSPDYHQPPRSSSATSATRESATSPGATADPKLFPTDEQQQPHVIVTLPAQPPAPWLLRDRITWGANLVLALLGYAGIMLALSTLKKIERQTRAVEAVASAASASAQAALSNAQAIADSGRPWLLIAVEPSPDIENSFSIMATNRGRSPARIVGTAEQVRFAIDDTQLPMAPEYSNDELSVPLVPIILLPGESAEIKPFSREDLKAICESDERLRSVENWEEKVYIYGKVIYRDLIAPPEMKTLETSWCCWYIHGRQKSGLVFAGPPEYNVHT